MACSFFSFLFFFLFFFFYLVSSQPATRVRSTDALRTVLVITTTLTLPAYQMHKRTATERMVRFSPVQWFFNFPGVSQSLCCDTGILYCPWLLCIVTFTQVLQSPRRWAKLSKTPKVYYICPAGLSLSPPLDPPLKCMTENNEVLIIIIIKSEKTANV